jgi:hypothetical protein
MLRSFLHCLVEWESSAYNLGGIIPAGRELLQGSMKLGSQAGTIA